MLSRNDKAATPFDDKDFGGGNQVFRRTRARLLRGTRFRTISRSGRKTARRQLSAGCGPTAAAAPTSDSKVLKLSKSRRAGSLTWFLRVISRLPKLGTITIHGKATGVEVVTSGKPPNGSWWPSSLVVGRNFRSPKTSQGRDTCKRPGAGPRLPLTPIKPSSPLSQDHQDLPDFRSVATEVVIQGWQLCARVSRFASGQEFGMKRSRRRDERSRRNGACARCRRAAAQKKL